MEFQRKVGKYTILRCKNGEYSWTVGTVIGKRCISKIDKLTEKQSRRIFENRIVFYSRNNRRTLGLFSRVLGVFNL